MMKIQIATFYTTFLSYLYTIEYPLQILPEKKREKYRNVFCEIFLPQKEVDEFTHKRLAESTNKCSESSYGITFILQSPDFRLKSSRDAIDWARKIRSCHGWKRRLSSVARFRMHRGGLDAGRFARIVTQITMIRVPVSRPAKRLGAHERCGRGGGAGGRGRKVGERKG